MKWEIVIGLEVHTQLLTQSKLFSGASTIFGGTPNAQACAIDIALPGVLPVLNRGVVELAIKFGLAIGAQINSPSIFARKNYFYPDLPKGYQISQYELPIIEGGHIKIQKESENEDKEKVINITRAHLEEDAGKSLHEDFHGMTGIDLNRAGTPLLEIVSEPDMRSSEEAVAFAKAIHTLVRWIGISDGNMEEGSFRCDANVSIRRLGDKKLGTRREIKNLNSFRFLQQAIECEIEFQKYILKTGGSIQQATVLFDSNKRETHVMRSKEDAHDYRYFPDPDLLPLQISSDWIEEIRASMIESPDLCFSRFIGSEIESNGKVTYALSKYDASILTSDIDTANYYEEVVKIIGREDAKLCANWVIEEVIAHLNQDNISITVSPVSPKQLAGLILRICDETISGKTAKVIFNEMWGAPGISADTIIKEKGLKQISDNSAITQIVDEVIFNNSQQVADYCSGKEKAFNFLIGQVMKKTKGKANPSQVHEILKERIKKR
ncbi:MAG: Asp-tRNA(Asn)/Glu-tRNA(Gln) amidotransferase GatCAB subunit B [Nitrosomonadaceae bacterium]|mgnify:CR=1 FL=1|nr:Asp-tRNA(Asn)/Glu-tRNA(Gln) amidotransferase GatCAB subunit B [Nitrosomonadaceae bacterium]|tara:strand:- start:365 stop:1846 length:1482 start_codon:yes stop_codon:yes gene_type:complete